MEYVFRLPDAMKLRWGRTKVILRQAFADLVPREILRRGKMGFGVPLRAWFTADLRGYLQDLLLAPDARLRGYVDQGYVRQLCQEHLSGRSDHSHRLWTLLTFEAWLRQLPTWSAPYRQVERPSSVGDAVRA
jgi:asparagine synthase (glutamine-hydrolysing)